MLEIFKFILVLQIGFNEALNYRGHNNNLLNPNLFNYGQTRRSLNPFRYSPLRKNPASDNESLDLDDSSLDERPKSLKYETVADNEASLEAAPVGRMDLDNFADVYQPGPSLDNHLDSNFRRPYLRHSLASRIPFQDRRLFRRGNNGLNLQGNFPVNFNLDPLVRSSTFNRRLFDDSNVDLFSNDQIIPNEDTDSYDSQSLRSNLQLTNTRRKKNDLLFDSQLNSDQVGLNSYIDNYVGNLLASISHSKLRRREETNLNQNAKFTRKHFDGSNIDWSSNDQLSLIDDTDSNDSLQSLRSNLESTNTRRNKNDLQFPDQVSFDAYNDNYIEDLASNDRSKLRRREPTNFDQNSKFTRRLFDLPSDDQSLNPDNDISSFLAPFRGLKPRLRSRKLPKDNLNVDNNAASNADLNIEAPELRNDNQKEDNVRRNNDDLRSNPREDDFDLSVIPLSTDYHNIEAPQSRRFNQNNNFRRADTTLAVSSNDRMSSDADASDQSDLNEDKFNDLTLVPSIRRSEASNQSNRKKNNENVDLKSRKSAEDVSLENDLALRSGNLDDISGFTTRRSSKNSDVDSIVLRSKNSDDSNFDSSMLSKPIFFRRSRDGLELKFPIARQGVDQSIKSNLQNQEQLSDKHEDKNLKNFTLLFEYPWDGKPSADGDNAKKKPAHLRLRSKNHNNRRTLDEPSLRVIPLRSNSLHQVTNFPLLRQGQKLDENQKTAATARESQEKDADTLLDDEENYGDFVAVLSN